MSGGVPAGEFVAMVSRLTHTADDDWSPCSIDDAIETLDTLIAKAREIQSTPTPPPSRDADVERVIAEAIGKADVAFSYSFNLTRLVDGEETHTLTMPGFDPIDFEDRDEGYALIAERRNAVRAADARAALQALGERG